MPAKYVAPCVKARDSLGRLPAGRHTRVASVWPRKYKYTCFLSLLLIVGFFLRLNNLSGRSLWTDEVGTIFQSSGHGLEIKDFLSHISRGEPQLLKAAEFKKFMEFGHHKGAIDVIRGSLYNDTHPPLYFLIIYFWSKLFGFNVFTIRLFSVVMGLFSIFLAYKLGCYLFSRDVAGFCALFVSICSFAVRFSQEARSYSLVTALGLLSWLFALRMEKNNKNSDALFFSIFNAAGLYTHYFFVFFSLAQFLYFTLVYHQDSARLNKFYLAFIFSLLLFSPWLSVLILKGYNSHHAEWVLGYPGLWNKIYYLFSGIKHYVLMSHGYNIFSGALLFTGLFLLIIMFCKAVKNMFIGYPRQLLFCLIMFALPCLTMFCIDIFQHGILLTQERFWTFSFLGFIPLAGYSIKFGFSRMKIVACMLVLILLISAVMVSKVQFGPAPLYASRWIKQESFGKPSAVIVYNIRSVIFSQSYYLDDNAYMSAVSDQIQLNSVIGLAYNYVDKLFVVRHYHPSDASLMNGGFMETKDIGSGFKLHKGILKDYISVTEYIK